ncbi:uncharacterized protein ACLA_023890 [Aspergillus clavatus NRRL 1]|uniref:Uncharacterized protein n=1 Tax=Aspergillus clavatus (strain ATCC 1007 / CBS 513.65 / DSM 816 / NCTC 3887 / NRRL 1 / QM 1276 / 107) TaxID=344612 RepID=A1CPV3_ASPCL|nr:uncharacterized protein ACLA_023890 [Aspergillus clavatus NRRL 1]EAW07674.1 conserved hypothetical protein [Aspergillus clavatus NRRL 1]
MWLYRGAQSAVFYYATCTPCAISVDRRKRKKEAVRSQREKEKIDAVVTDQPKPFPQPTPFSTNPGWAEEIALGPGPPTRRGGHRNNHRRTDSWNTDAFSPVDSCPDGGGEALRKDKSSLKHPLGDRWNRMRYQREDEPLWGEEVEVKGSSVGISGRGKADSDEPSKYYVARVPPVNDLHPPIVSGPKSRAETRWMLQPPPSARVMAGKEPSNTAVRQGDHGGQPKDIRKNKTVSGPAQRNRQLPPLTTQATERKAASKPTPTVVSPYDYMAQKAPAPESDSQPQSSRELQPSLLPYGRDESTLVISVPKHARSDSPSTIASLGSSEADTPSISWQCPETPTSRPGSKANDDSSRNVRPKVAKTLSTSHQDNKMLHLYQLEINDDGHDEFGLGQFEPLRPWRWSMDI